MTPPARYGAPPAPSQRTRAALEAIGAAVYAAPVGSLWRHRKGGQYVVTGHALCTTSGTATVLYQRIGGPEYSWLAEQGLTFARPLEEWTAERFTPAQLAE